MSIYVGLQKERYIDQFEEKYFWRRIMLYIFINVDCK